MYQKITNIKSNELFFNILKNALFCILFILFICQVEGGKIWMHFQLCLQINQMRLITRNQYPLHIWKVSDYIKQTQANIVKQDANRFITMQNLFKKLYLRHLKDHEILQVHLSNLNNFVNMSPSPARSITDYFHTKSKQYSQDFMRATFESLAKAYHISKTDNGGSLDTLGYTLFLSAQFCNLSEELKYALRNNKVTFPNLTAIVQSLITMEYVDFEIVNLLLLYTRRELTSGDQYVPLSDWNGDRQYQIEKKDYYKPEEIATLEALRKCEEVNTAISFVRHIYEQNQKDSKLNDDLKKQNVGELNRLIIEISETNKNFRKIVEGIINIRREYARMVELSGDQQILRNPNLNLQLLQTQQKLINIKLIDIYDIKNIKQMSNPDYEIKRVQEILLQYLNVKKLDPIFTFVDKSNIQIQSYKDNNDTDPKKVSVLLNLLSKLASIDRFVYHTADGRSLVNLKWQKTLIDQVSGPYVPSSSLKEQLNVSRIFRRVYSDTLSLFRTYDSKIKQTYKRCQLQDKILILDSFCRIGEHEKAIIEANQFQNSQFEINFSQISKQNFENLIHLFNDIGLFISNNSLKDALFRKLQQNIQLQETNRLNYSLRYTIDATNYLLQNHRNHLNFQKVYKRYLSLLETKATYPTPEDGENQVIVEAFKILSLQIPEKYGSHPVYLNYIMKFAKDSYKKNPYHSILRETCYKWCRKENWLNKLQIHLNLGVNNGVENGVIFSNSDETSLDGQIRNGDLNSFILRLEAKNKMRVHQFSVNSFLNISYNKEKFFELKPLTYLEGRFQQIFQYQSQPYQGLYQKLLQSIDKVLQAYPQCPISNQIHFKIAVLNKLAKNGFNIQTKQQEYTSRASFLLQVLELNKLILLLDESQILTHIIKKPQHNPSINTKLAPHSAYGDDQSTIPVNVKDIQSHLRHIKTSIPQLVQAISQHFQQILITQKNPNSKLHGERQTLQVLPQDETAVTPDLSIQFINYRYFTDNSFCEYRDWRQKIQQKYKLVEMGFDNMTNLSKILTNKFCSGIHNKVTFLPICKHQQSMKRITLQFKLLKQTSQLSSAPNTAVTPSPASNKELDYIINLQNFKYQLKTTFSPKKLLDYIFGFKFIFQLNKRNTERVKELLNRNPEEYFNYLQQLNERTYIESPYAKYILSKLSKTDKIKRLIQHRKDVRLSQRILYQQGVINSKTYYERINLVQDQIIEAVSQLKTKLLDNMQDTILSDEMKMVDIKKDELQVFEELIRKNFDYSRHFDQDFICANGNYQKALNYKRGRAQSNYIKLYLLKKIAQNQTLNIKQLQLLKSWDGEIVGSINKFTANEEFTTMLISELPWEDLQALRLKSSSLNSNKDMLLIDLIMEFNLFLDDSLIKSYEKQFKAQIISSKYHIPLFLFEQSATVGLRKLQNEVEEAIINEQAQLNEEDVNNLQQIFKIFKTQGFRERNRYNILCANFRQNVGIMNKSIIRSELIQQYIKHLEEQFMSQYNPQLVKQIKQEQTDKLWRQIFHNPYNQCSRDRLKEVTKKLIIRLQLLDQRVPPFFGNLLLKLLMHPNIDSLTRQTLVAAIQHYKFDLNLDSGDIANMAKFQGRGIRQSEKAKEELRLMSRLKVGRLLREKAKLLL